jgi:S1-C subfamily serine protease
MHFPTTKVTDMFVADMWVVGGNSGGPVLNVNGEVMGLACMGIVTNFGVTPTGLNLFVNVKHVKALLDNAMAYGKFTGKFTVIPPQEEVEPCYSVSPY